MALRCDCDRDVIVFGHGVEYCHRAIIETVTRQSPIAQEILGRAVAHAREHTAAASDRAATVTNGVPPGHVAPSARAQVAANEYADRMGWPRPYPRLFIG